jgi:hypothetical protein
LPAATALAAFALALASAIPFAFVFDQSGGSVWPGAIIHATIQCAAKLFEAGDSAQPMILGWMALSALAPWIVFLVRLPIANRIRHRLRRIIEWYS